MKNHAMPIRNGQIPLDLNTQKQGSNFAKKDHDKFLAPLKPTPVYETYWRFAYERQEIFFNKIDNTTPPWTQDPILSIYKFTNAYRAADRVSQYLIRHVIYRGDQSPCEVFFRTILFKVFNKIETWQLLKKSIGEIAYSDYKYSRYDKILTHALKNNVSIFSAAYIMPTGAKNLRYSRKHRTCLKLIEMFVEDKVYEKISETKSLQEGFEILRSYPLMGDFLAYQFIIDLNYSEMIDFSENEFVIPGPGARDGLRKCFYDFGNLSQIEVIKFMADRQQDEFKRLGLKFKNLWGRDLRLIDCQNLFCEVDKYSRIAHPEFIGISGRSRIKQKYSLNTEKIDFWFPPKWKINHKINL